jgi:aldehyde dehydrogenase (NAD+)
MLARVPILTRIRLSSAAALHEVINMREMLQFYIDGKWIDPVVPNPLDVINPATEEVCGRISLGSAKDVDKAVAAACKAQDSFASTSRQQRIDLLQSILVQFA